jgi:nitrate/nitrite-specific signal transduction histidine kinase
MRERARYYNGHVKITGVRGKGSTVMVSIPLPERSSRHKRLANS